MCARPTECICVVVCEEKAARSRRQLKSFVFPGRWRRRWPKCNGQLFAASPLQPQLPKWIRAARRGKKKILQGGDFYLSFHFERFESWSLASEVNISWKMSAKKRWNFVNEVDVKKRRWGDPVAQLKVNCSSRVNPTMVTHSHQESDRNWSSSRWHELKNVDFIPQTFNIGWTPSIRRCFGRALHWLSLFLVEYE